MSLWDFMVRQQDRLIEASLQHLLLILLVVLAAAVIGIGLALASYRNDRASNLLLSTFSVFLTIPSFALFGILIAVVGLGWPPTIVALTMYALLPIYRNTLVGLREVDAAVVDAARGMGMSRWRTLVRIELPLAWPVVVTGLRVSAMINVGVAAIAAIVGGPGLGEFIFRGLSRIGGANAMNLVLSGTILIVVLGLLLDAAFLLLAKFTTPRGIRA